LRIFFSSRRRYTSFSRDWSSDVCSSDLEFNDYRSKMNDKILADGNNKIIKRIFNLDTNAYAEGALDVKTKELLGLVASAVLRCRSEERRVGTECGCRGRPSPTPNNASFC